MDTNKYIPTVEAIEKASGVLEEILEPTPFQKNQNLSDIYGANIFLKRGSAGRFVTGRTGGRH